MTTERNTVIFSIDVRRMRNWLALSLDALSLGLLTCIPTLAQYPHAVVNVPVANMFSGPSAHLDVVSQAIYGTTIDVLKQQPDWVEIRTPSDQYTGWVRQADLVDMGESSNYASSGEVAVVEELQSHLYSDPSVTHHAPLLTVPFETRLEIVQEKPGGRWLLASLPDGRKAWVQQGDVKLYQHAADIPKGDKTIPEMIRFSRGFLGLPYTWGGTSSFGYDCSGFVQMLMRQRGYSIPRDADVEAAWSGFEPVSVRHLRAGDVLFFGHNGKITHTGMYIGHGKFIDATTYEHPVIQIDKLNKYWRKALIAERRVKP